jgi:peptidyl-prolyl cis-trans isomerase B (cyclophilin B)
VARPEPARSRRDREAARQRAQEEARADAYRRAARRRGLIGIGVVIGIILAVVGVIKAASGEQERKAATRSTAGGSTTSTVATGPTAALPAVAPGSTLDGVPPCPPHDASAGRVTHFSQAPPDCLDPAADYGADVRTSKGTLTIDLYETEARAAVNTFVFLARYHYYDGLPFTSVRRGAFAEVADPTAADGTPGPGFRQPTVKANAGNIMTSLLFGLTPQGGSTGGGLTVGMPGDQYTTIPADTTAIGLIRDARTDRRPGAPDDQRTVQQLINDAASPSGAPTQAITIEGVDITEEPAR